MAKTLEQLLSLSSIIANETKAGANTALRVGGLFSDIIYYLRDLDYADKEDIPSLEGYATEQWVLGKGYATTTDLDARIDALVNGAPQAYDTLKEIADVLAGNVNSISDILTALGNKADKATTLSGYGITDAYTITQIDSIVKELSGDISTLEGYFTDGVANSALKLSDNGSYTAWGQTFFTNGKPKSLSGALTDVTDIASSGTITTNKIVIGNGTIEWDEANKGFKVTGLYSTTYLSAKGANTNGGGSSGGGLITSLYRYADLGKTFADTNNDTFNAYTINKINTDLGSRISVLEGKATNVSFTQSLTSGTQIGSISIDGVTKNIYAPTIPTEDINKGVTAYGWGNHASVGYQLLITSTNKLDYSLISGVPTKLSQFTNDLGLGTFAYKSSLAFADLTDKPTTIGGFGITDAYTKTQVDSALGGYLPLSGGMIRGVITLSGYEATNVPLNILTPSMGYTGYIRFGAGTSTNEMGHIGFSAKGIASILYEGTKYDIIHSGNIGSQSVARAKILVTAAGDSIVYVSGSTFYIGDSIYTEKSTHILGSDVRLRYGASATTGMILNSSGNVGIGTTSPQYNLHVKSVAPALMCESTASESSIYFSASSENAYRWAIGKGVWNIGGDFGIGEYNTAQKIFFRIAKNGNVGIGLSYTTAPSYKLHINGTLHASDAVSFGSTLDVTGAITKPTTSGSNMTNNYISAGGGFSSGTGKYGVKILCCDQADAQTGLGQDLGGLTGGYELSVVGGTSSSGQGYISFVTHGVNSTSYRKLGYFYDNKGVISFDVLGTIHSTTGIWSDGYVSAKGQNTSSDMRLKNVINEVVLGVKDIANAPSVRFAWKNGGGIDVGSSAQYWQGLLPDAVKERDGMLEMQYANIALLSAIALAKNFETHEERIARLEKENKELRNEIKCLKYGA